MCILTCLLKVAEDEREPADMYPLDAGHHFEGEFRTITALILDCEIKETGIWLHPKYTEFHVSPDGNVMRKDDGRLANVNQSKDSRGGNYEHKLMMYSVNFNRRGVQVNGFPHGIKGAHVIQMQAQNACTGATWTYYDNSWRWSHIAGMLPLPDGPFFYGNKTSTPGAWKAGEKLVSIVYANPDFGNEIYKHMLGHVARCRNRHPPKHIHHVHSKHFTFDYVPLVHVVFYLSGSPGSVQEQKELKDADCILKHVGSKAPRPKDWVGEWPPRKRVAIRRFYTAKRYTFNLDDLDKL